LDDQKSISLLTQTDESYYNNTITLNLDEMSELNASIITTTSLLANLGGKNKNNNNESNDFSAVENNKIFIDREEKQQNGIKYQFYNKNQANSDVNNKVDNSRGNKNNIYNFNYDANYNNNYFGTNLPKRIINANNNFCQFSGEFRNEKDFDFDAQRVAEENDNYNNTNGSLDETKFSRKI